MSQPPIDNDTAVDAAAPVFIDARRRGLLHGAAVAAVAGSTGALAGAASAAPAVPDPAEPTVEGDRGYQLTDHVREYYAKARG